MLRSGLMGTHLMACGKTICSMVLDRLQMERQEKLHLKSGEMGRSGLGPKELELKKKTKEIPFCTARLVHSKRNQGGSDER